MPQVYRHDTERNRPTPSKAVTDSQLVSEYFEMLENTQNDKTNHSLSSKSVEHQKKRKVKKGRTRFIAVILIVAVIALTIGVFLSVNRIRNRNDSSIVDPPTVMDDIQPDVDEDTTDLPVEDPIEQDKQEPENYPYEVSLKKQDGIWWLTIDGYDMIFVNKRFHLPPEYGNGITPEASQAYQNMAYAADSVGLPIYIISGYRSYQTQLSIFQGWVEYYGSEEEANRVSARAGQSEHQTGLAMDIGSSFEGYDLSFRFGETQTGQWLARHAHEYGFILRYAEEMEEVTGYKYEPWHFRYVGVELATLIKESGLCVEEFLPFVR